MAKIYFPTYNTDLKINNGKELQLKQPATGKTLNDCDLGSIVYLPETVSGAKDFHDYIVVEKNDNNVVLLRKYVDTQVAGGSSYINDTMDVWCNTTFKDRFSQMVLENLLTKEINSNYRSFYVPSRSELNSWFSTNSEKKATLSSSTTAVEYNTRDFDAQYIYYVTTSGSYSYSTNKTRYCRPAIVFSPDTLLNSSNQFIDEPTYTDTIDTVKFGDDLYRLKDIRLPDGNAVGDIPIWNGSAWIPKQPSRLPSAYQEVEYIESDGTGQYIDTGVPCNEIYEICGDIKFNAIQEADIGVFSSTGTNYKGYSIGIDTNNKFRAQLPNYGMAVAFENASTNRFKFYISEILGSYWTESAFATINKHAPFTSANFHLFARYNADTTPPEVQRYCNMRLYHIAFKGKDNLISHDFVPCYRKSDNEIGMYDIVNGVFHTNAGTGDFTCYPLPMV